MKSRQKYGRGLAAPCQPHVLGRILAGVGLVAIVAKALRGGRRQALRRAAWHHALGRFASQPLPIDQPAPDGPVHRIAVG